VLSAVDGFTKILDGDRYISKVEYGKWYQQWNQLEPLLSDWKNSGLLVDFDSELDLLNNAFENGEDQIQESNEGYIREEILRFKEFFDSIEAHPLTKSQRRAIVIDEKCNLVVAGVGTGKTSTIIGKAGYVIERGFAEPHEVLLIAFARDARNEMEERTLTKLGSRLRVQTFHSLGLGIVSEVEGVRPSVSVLSTDRTKLQESIERFIQEKIEDRGFLQRLNRYFAYHSIPHKSDFNFSSMGEYIDYIRQFQLRSLKGDLVKSLEECEIANFLYLNGVEYVYEGKYEVDTASLKHRQYTPDFYLPEFDVYIEHFGVDRNNNTAQFVDRDKYLTDMAWKRRLHRENRTRLVETYSWEKSEGILTEDLVRKLTEAGVVFNHLSPEKVFERINELGLVHPFTGLLSTFLSLYKSSRKTIDELLEEAKELPSYPRYKAFLEIFSDIYWNYEKALGDEIDFDDMIIKAEEYVSAGKYQSDFKYILVDESQDISYSRYRLLKALIEQNTESNLFCVGDDWQSIYRFTGCDVSIMTDFDGYFYPSERMTLDKTFRFDDKLCEFSSKFILKNPNQIEKHLTTDTRSISPSVSLVWSDYEEDSISEILSVIDNSESDKAEVFIIGRYNRQRPSRLYEFQRKYPKLDVKYKTAHGSKGTEADYVIVVGLSSKGYAFPSQFVDDPVLELVLAKREVILNAEERRLFYVAVTRARKHVYLVVDMAYPSPFALEVENEDYDIIVRGSRSAFDVKCPECKTGVLTLRRGDFGEFYSCSNYPYCSYKPHMCPRCGEGIIVESGANYMCSKAECGWTAPKCPECEDGYLVLREGYSKFYGCSNYPNCEYTRRLRPRYRG
jgi:DNA helicase-4